MLWQVEYEQNGTTKKICTKTTPMKVEAAKKGITQACEARGWKVKEIILIAEVFI